MTQHALRFTRSSHATRFLALLWLIPLGAIWWWYCTHVPYEWQHATQVSRLDDKSFYTSIDSDASACYLSFNMENQTWKSTGQRPNRERSEFEENLAATLNPEGTEIQFRSLKDGSITKTVPLESPIDTSAVQVEVTSTAVVVQDLDDTYFYSLEDGKRMLNPLGENSEPMSLSMELTPDRRYALWWKWGMGEAVITDAHTGAEIRRIKDHAPFFRMMDNSTVVAVDGTMGITIRRYDLTDQSRDKIWRPFWWVMPLQVFVVIGSGVWIWHWLRLPRPNAHATCIDLVLLLILIMAVIIGRLMAVGDPSDLTRSPYLTAMLLTGSYLLMASTWLAFSKSSIASRLTILVTILAITVGSFSYLNAERIDQIGSQLSGVALPSLLFIPIAFLGRIGGFRLAEKSTDPSFFRQRPTIAQLLLLTLAFAFLFASNRSPWSSIYELFNLRLSPLDWIMIVIFSWVGITGFSLGLSTNPTIRKWSMRFWLFLGILLVLEGLLHADLQYNLGVSEWLYDLCLPFHVYGASFFITFAGAHTLYNSGVRWQRAGAQSRDPA